MNARAKGFGLIEIMVAMVIGLIVSLGIVQVFIASKGTYQTQNASARMQEDARFILSKLVQEIRMTGMYGCLNLDKTAVAPAINEPQELGNPILWTAASNTLILITADVGNAGTAPTWTIVSDCRATSRLYLNLRAPATGETAFPIRKITYTLQGGDLRMKVGNGADDPQVVLSNVLKLEVSFGVTGSPMSYVNTVASTVEASKIRSVRLTLVLSDPAGRVANQTYSVVAALRNRF
jgi:type IV pilus assembly protein PilW